MANLRANRITSTEVFETTGSVQFDGSGDYLSLAVSSDFQFGSEDFTIECWAYTPNTGTKDILGIYNTGANRRTFALRKDQTESVQFLYSSNGTSGISIDSEDGIINLNEWNHYAVVRKDLEYIIYLNGIRLASQYSADAIYTNTSDGLRIGSSYNTDFEGHISNVRILKGTALYTANFTPPTRELEVIPNTVLLACQSTTKADEEKTGKTITVNGNAVANELTPGLLTSVVKSGGSSAITGSVFFDGTDDNLTIPASTDLNLSSGDFTVEGFVYTTRSQEQSFVTNWTGTNTGQFQVQMSSTRLIQASWAPYSTSVYAITGSTPISLNAWHHFAYTRSGSTFNLFLDGISQGTQTSANNASTNTSIKIGENGDFGTRDLLGYISNVRIIKGTALYTSNFIPPARKLTKLPGTVLLCCQDSNDPTTEATGKTITANGDPTATRFTPQVGSDGSVEFAGPITINTENYFYFPTGPTEQRGRGRGVFGAGNAPTKVNSIDYIEIQTLGNAQDFGDLIDSFTPGQTASLSSSTRGLFAGGTTPTVVNTIQYITIATTSNASDFGDLTETKWSSSGCSSSTRGIVAGGRTPTHVNSIDYVTIQSTGDAQEFGDLTQAKNELGAASSPTRGIFMGGQPGSGRLDRIEYITIATTGNASVFGTLGADRNAGASVSNQTRALFAGGIIDSPTLVTVNTIEYITIASTGNASDFGDLILARYGQGGCSNSIRGVFAGEEAYPTPAVTNTIQYITIASTGNAQDFGDLTVATFFKQGLSDSHGGLG